jgi:MscS family membrane protein
LFRIKFLVTIFSLIVLSFRELSASELSYFIESFESSYSLENNISEEDLNKLIEKKSEILNLFISEILEDNLTISDINENDRIEFLSKRISLNSSKGRSISLARDNIELLTINLKLSFVDFIKSILNGRTIYLTKKELDKIIDDFIASSVYDLAEYEKYYENYKDSSAGGSIGDFVLNYQMFTKKQQTYLEIASYLKLNVDKLERKSLFLSLFNLEFLSKFIDETDFGKSINPYSEHYLNLKFGKIVLSIFAFLIILSFRNYFIPKIISLFDRLAQKNRTHNIALHQYLSTSISSPIRFALLIFAVEIALVVLSSDNTKIDSFILKLHTLYIVSFVWIIFNLLNNVILFFSESITSQYPNVRREMVNFFVTIFKGILFITIIILLLKDFGYDVTTIVASLGVGGIAIALAAQNTLSNFFGSLTIILDNSFSQGDWIESHDVEGTVVELGLRSTTVRTFDNALVTVPNSSLANSPIKNWSRRVVGRRIKASIGVTYESKKVDILNAVNDIRDYLLGNSKIADSSTIIDKKAGSKLVKKEDFVGVKNNLLVYFDEYGSSSINILVYCFTKTTDWQEYLETKEEVLSAIWDIIEKNNLEFAYPTQKIFLEKLSE